MKTKQEQIDEMVGDMDYGCTKRDLYPDDAKEIAKALYLLGYRKLQEDSVVLSREEYIDLSRTYVKEQKAQAVKEFLEELKEKALSHCRIINCYELKFIETTIDDLLYDWQGHPPVCKCELKIDELLKECEK